MKNKSIEEKKYNVVIIGSGNIGAFYDEPGSEQILTHAHAFSVDTCFASKSP